MNSSWIVSQNQYSVRINQPEPLIEPSICLVSVTEDNNNIIVWEKPINDFIDYFKIYREFNEQTDRWDSIGITLNSDLSIFIDSTSQSEIQSYRYKISSVDKCGNETSLSNLHKTMNLSILKSMNNTYSLVWDEYEGFEVYSYRIYRGIDKDDLSLIGSVTAGNFNYNDTYSSEGDIYYQVEVLCPLECNTNNLKSSSVYYSSRSNIVTNLRTSINKSEFGSEIKIFPNPFNSKTNISFYNGNHQLYILNLYDINGKNVYSQTTSEGRIEFDRNNLSNGFYYIELKGNNTLRGKMLIL
ncbi:T9SS type A sorting domain-containing protein [Bacteroidota bacterium]